MLSKGKTRFGITVPQMFPDGDISPEYILQQVKLARKLGFEDLWVQERVLGEGNALDPFTLMAYIAPYLDGATVGVSVIVLTLYNPVQLAKITATVDHLLGGKLVLGVGLGRYTERYPAFGITTERRVVRFTEALRLLKRLWTEHGVTHQGDFWQMERINILPKPMQKPHPPIWFGAYVDDALRRSVRLGNGWMLGGGYSIRQFRDTVAKVRQYLEEEGKDPTAFPIGKRVYVAIDRDKKRAMERLQNWFANCHRGAFLADEVPIYGTEGEITEQLGELLQLAPDLVVLNPVYDIVEQTERLAKEVIADL